LLTHPERKIPFCIGKYKIVDDNNKIIFEKEGNNQTINRIKFDQNVKSKSLTLILEHPDDNITAALFEIRCYS
jgi:hypothetical protein